MSDDSGDRTIRASNRRRSEARAEGVVARSREFSVALQLLVGAGLLFLLGRSLVESLAGMLASQLRSAGESSTLQTPLTPGDVGTQAGQLAAWSSTSVLPWLLVPLAVAILAGLSQTGFLLLPGKLSPTLGRVSPLGGLRRVFSVENAAGAGLNLVRLFVLLTTTGLFLYSQLEVVVSLVRVPLGQAALTMGSLIASLSLILALSCVVLGAADYGYRRWKYEQDLMMTPDEFRRELRDAEGDPKIRNARRAAGRQRPAIDETAAVVESSTSRAI
ncbi:MAG: EscU/YscU/HrcU family type III secretion system export apparatus switch protein [Planctomycetota bacterium]|nr:EscU/YscU/HrcU family type III secretion system export apparatus switch protein [Planctomycetota bacterium]